MVNEINKAQVVEIKEIKNEIPSYEEFLKNYKRNEALEAISEAEWQDKVLNGPQYGPGNNMSSEDKKVVKTVGGVALTTLTIICPPAGLLAGTGVAVGGATTAIIGASDNNSEVIMEGLEVFAMGMGSAVKGAYGSSSHKGYVCSLPICPKK